MLRAIGGLIQGSLEADDYAGRYGGEEMLLVLSDSDDRGAERVLKLHHLLRGTPFAAAGHPLRLTCSIGIAWARSGDDWGVADRPRRQGALPTPRRPGGIGWWRTGA